MDEPKSLDFTVIGEPLNKLLVAVGNKLEREWPQRYRNVTGARELFVMHLRTAHTTYLSALYLCGDIPPDHRRKAEFSVCLPVLNRALLDSLFAILFILEDLPNRCEWFWESDWRELRLELDRYLAEYGNLPEWRSWLAQLTEHCNRGIAHAKLSPTQTADPSKLRSWLNVGAMLNFGVSPNVPLPPPRAFMKYLNDPETEALLKRNKYGHIGQKVALVLALASEIEAHFNFGLRQEALFVWGVAVPNIVVVEEMYRKRYRELLQS